MSHASARRGAIAASLALVGCSADGPPLVAESPHFRVHAYPEEAVCGLVGERLETHYATLASFLHVALPEGDKIDVFKYRNVEQMRAESPCPSDSHGCGGKASAYVYDWNVLEHELVHAYAAIAGTSPKLFEEGLAIVLQEGDGASLFTRSPSYAAAPLEEVLETDAWDAHPESRSGAAGSFTRFLVERGGMGTFRDFQARTDRDAEVGSIEKSFAVSFGEPLSSALAAWRAGPADTLGAGWLPHLRCAAPPLVVGEIQAITELSCGRDHRAFSLGEPTGIAIRIRHERNVSTHLGHCDGSRPLWPASLLLRSDGPQAELWTTLPAGDYFLSSSAFTPNVDVVRPDITIERAPLIGDRCESATERLIAAATETLEVPLDFAAHADDGGDAALLDAFLRFRVEAPRRVSLDVSPADVFAADTFADGAEHRTLASLCPADCADGACEELGQSPVDLEPNTPYVVRLEGTVNDRRTFRLSFAD
jgi:hypothetical protein